MTYCHSKDILTLSFLFTTGDRVGGKKKEVAPVREMKNIFYFPRWSLSPFSVQFFAAALAAAKKPSFLVQLQSIFFSLGSRVTGSFVA